LFYYVTNIINHLDKSFSKKGFFCKNLNVFFYIIKDVNVFSELKTNLGLFNLKQPLHLNMYLTGCDKNINKNKILINILKL
jgi:hypothetical protein